ncbi:MAG: tRNA methyltransferase [Nitrospinae bacterium CG11_big_fil_rev_8_21_14_0_20_56_8]|nr:MAG: tRNA methyltransferase [Nitrospinae bacterium CG11_big_fil_rev_8_21_14_0_20_56_8]
MARTAEAKPVEEKPRPDREPEFTLYGWNACRAAFDRRPEALKRLYYSIERSRELAPVKKWCGDHQLPYRELDGESLSRAAKSVHHEGVVMVLHEQKIPAAVSLIQRGLKPGEVAVALDGVENTHNLGAILRSSAFFGAMALVLSGAENQADFTPSAARMAEGGFETVPVYRCTDLASVLRDLREKKVFVLGADLKSNQSLYETEVPFPCVVVMGGEREGLSAPVRRRCDAVVHVPGAGPLQSLNVSVAAGVILAELNRRKMRRP